MRSHAKASSAESTHRQVAGLSLAAVLTALAFLLISAVSAPPAWALDTCPNVVFRTGPSAKLPECRAYELVSPPDTEGLPPSSSNFGNLFSSFPHATIAPSGERLYFQTQGGALGQSPGTGIVDRYGVTRTSQGWVTSFEGITGSQAQDAVWYGGASPDLAYYPTAVANTRLSAELPPGSYLHTPNGLEVLAKGSLGEFLGGGENDRVQAFAVTNGGQHVVFFAPSRLEPNAPGGGLNVIYDRSVGGPTHVVSLLPGNVTPSSNANLAGVSPDGRDVAFQTSKSATIEYPEPRYVRHDNTTTYEVVRPEGVIVGKELSCEGQPGSATLTYQWLRNGAEIPGASSSTYTTTVADEGKTVQCQVTASNADGTSVNVSAAKVVEPYEGKDPAIPGNFQGNANGASVSGTPTVGQLLTCTDGGQWKGSPTFTYQWYRNGTEVPLATNTTNTTYTTAAADKGKAIQCRVKGTNGDGAALAFSFPMLIGGVVASASANPAISNVTDPGNAPAAGDELSCSSGTWTNSPSFTYQWLRGGTAIGGATSATYTVAAADEEKTLQCIVTATTADSSTQAVSDRLVVDPQPATTPPQQSFPGEVWGSATVGGTLHCEEGGWSGEPSISRQWLRNGAEIAGATENSYTLTASDLETVIQCRLTATNAGGNTVAINAGSFAARYVQVEPPEARATIPNVKHYFTGVYGGRVFYASIAEGGELRDPGDLYSFDIATQKTAMISPDAEDSIFSHISADGSHAYFLSKTEVNGEGEAGKPNLYVWRASDQSTKLVATLGAQDPATNEYLDLSKAVSEKSPGLIGWLLGQQLEPRHGAFTGPSESHPESSADGSVLLFTARSQLTSFDNTEAAAGDCQDPTVGGERCNEIYRYDSNTGEITCVSCPPGPAPAQGDARLHFVFGGDEFNFAKAGLLDNATTIQNMTDDTETVFFETRAALVPSDGNGHIDIYRWNAQTGLALISSGQGTTNSLLYGVSPSGSDVVFATEQTLVAGDENGSVRRLYDARVDGGFPPPESTVTEPCSGDACQGQSSAAPQPPNTASSALNGGGNVSQVHCPKGRRKVTRNGKEACARKHHRKARKHRRHRAAHNRRTGR